MFHCVHIMPLEASRRQSSVLRLPRCLPSTWTMIARRCQRINRGELRDVIYTNCVKHLHFSSYSLLPKTWRFSQHRRSDDGFHVFSTHNYYTALINVRRVTSFMWGVVRKTLLPRKKKGANSVQGTDNARSPESVFNMRNHFIIIILQPAEVYPSFLLNFHLSTIKTHRSNQYIKLVE